MTLEKWLKSIGWLCLFLAILGPLRFYNYGYVGNEKIKIHARFESPFLGDLIFQQTDHSIFIGAGLFKAVPSRAVFQSNRTFYQVEKSGEVMQVGTLKEFVLQL